MNYTKQFTFSLCLLFGICCNLFAQDVVLVGVELDDYLAPGEHSMNILIQKAQGSPDITSFEAQVTVNGSNLQTFSFDNLSISSSSTIYPATLPYPITIGEIANEHNIEVIIIEVNGGADEDASDNQFNHIAQRLTASVEKQLLVEKITATWCPNCPAANVILEGIIDDYPNQILDLHWHRADEFSIPEFDDFDDVYSVYQPRALLDRYVFPEHIGGNYDSSPGMYRSNGWEVLTAYKLPISSPIQLAVETDYSSSNDNLTIDIDATFYADLLDGEYRFNAYIIETGVTASQSGSGGNSNYPQNNIVRAVLGGMWGSEGSLPSNIEEGDTHSHQYVYDVPSNLDPDDLKVVVIVQRYNDDASDPYSREILNAIQVDFDASNSLEVTPIETFCSIDAEVPEFTASSTVLCADQTSQLQIAAPAPSGFEYQWQLNGNDLDGENDQTATINLPGNYTVYLTDGDGCVSQSSDALFVGTGGLPNFDVDIDIDDLTVTVNTSFAANPGNVGIEWSFGDGNYGTGQDTEHTYSQPGTYAVCPTISNDCETIGDCYLVEIPHPFQLDGTVLLEGAYDANGEMNADLQDLIPVNQPYNVAPYNYEGLEQIPVIPNDMVDWVLVEARTGTPGTTAEGTTVVETTAALLLADGSLKEINGTSGVGFNNLVEGEEYHFVVRHRNHLDIISANPVVASSNMAYDFTTSASQASGNSQLKASDDGYFYMYTGDFSQDGVIQISDFDVWKASPAILESYETTDANLDRVVQITDFDAWLPNKAKIGSIEIRF